MRLRMVFSTLFLVLAGSLSFAGSQDISALAAPLYKGTDACFLLYDVSAKEEIASFNKKRCGERIAPDSTFKVALSLMAFDSKIITQESAFKWDGVPKGMDLWNKDQTPKSWLQFSVVWVSQQIAPRLGARKIRKYLKKFAYGNQDFSGNPGKNDGLTEAWLESSLKISAEEQVEFLKKMIAGALPVSKGAARQTFANMYLQELDNGAGLYGKTGAGFSPDRKFQNGWFVGVAVRKDGRQYVFASNLTGDLGKDLVSSLKAKGVAIVLLNELLK